MGKEKRKNFTFDGSNFGFDRKNRIRNMKRKRIPFIRENSIIKIGIDILAFVALWLILLWVLPRNALFFHVSEGQTTTPKLTFTIATTAIILVLFRLLLKNYGKSWSRTRALDLMGLSISDAIAGLACYVVLRKLLHAQYPFLLFAALFSINCILSLFIRLVYMGVADVLDITDV